MTISDSAGHHHGHGKLAAVADTAYLYDGRRTNSPIRCMACSRSVRTTANSQQDVFVQFEGNAMIFSSFETGLPIAGYAPYTYFYGVGLK